MQRGFPRLNFLDEHINRIQVGRSVTVRAKARYCPIFLSNSTHFSHNHLCLGHLDVQSTDGRIVPSVSGESRIDAQMPALSRFLQFDLRPERCGFRRLWSW